MARKTSGPVTPPSHGERSVERDAIDIKRISGLGLLFLIVIVACAALVQGFERNLSQRYHRDGTAAAKPSAPLVAGPPPQPAPQADLAAYRAEKNVQLKTYRYIDRPNGIVQIPIEEAMHLLATQNAAPGDSR